MTEQLALWQLMPELSTEEYAALKADIAARGVMVPVEYDETGAVLDGHHRLRACEELGITEWPRIVRGGLSDEDKLEHVLTLNLARRHLSREQRRELVGNLRERGWSFRRIGERLGVHHDTVADDLSVVGFPTPERITGADGKSYPATRPKSVHAATAEQQQAASAVIAAAVAPGETVAATDLLRTLADVLREARGIKTAQREERVEAREAKQAEVLAADHPLSGDAFRLLTGDFIEALLDQPDESVDVIITDPPYGQEFLPEYSRLSGLAARILRPGGSCLVMTGQAHLEEVLTRLSESLRYQWTCAYVTPGQSTQVFGRFVKCNWKPVVWLTKGAYAGEQIADVFRSEENDKAHHEWGQSVGGMKQIVEAFTVTGELVCDPFCGGGATGVAVVLGGRLFLGVDQDEASVKTTAQRLGEAAEAWRSRN